MTNLEREKVVCKPLVQTVRDGAGCGTTFLSKVFSGPNIKADLLLEKKIK